MKNVLKNMIQGVFDRRSKTYLYLYHRLYNKSSFPSMQHMVDLYASKREPVFFVQVGANEGSTEDPLFQHIRLRNWKGMLIEPLAEEFDKLRKNHEMNPGLIFENVAISKQKETKTFYTIDKTKGDVPFWVSKLSSFDPAITNQIKDEFPHAEILTKDVECCTVHDLIQKNGIEKVDLLLIDTEGYDYEIIKTIQWDKVRPEMVIFEHRHLSEADYQNCVQDLANQDYHLYRAEHDTIAFTPDFLFNTYQDHLMKL